MVVGVLHEPGVDLHLAGQHRLEVVGHVRPGADLLGTGGELRVRRHDALLLLAGQGLLPQHVPSRVERALVLGAPLGGHVVGGVGGSRGEVHEEGLVGHERLLTLDPGDGVVGQVLGEVVALLGGLRRLDRGDAVVEGGVPLVGLGSHEAVEVLEATARRPLVERPHRARLPDRHLVAFPELGRAVPVQEQGLGDRGGVVRPDRVVARSRGGDLGDPAHADGVVVSGRQEGLARRRAQGGGVEPIEPQPVGRQSIGHRRVARATEGRRGPESGVVDHDDDHVRGTFGRPERLNRRIGGVRVLGVVGRQPHVLPVRNRQVASREITHWMVLPAGFTTRRSAGRDPGSARPARY